MDSDHGKLMYKMQKIINLQTGTCIDSLKPLPQLIEIFFFRLVKFSVDHGLFVFQEQDTNSQVN